MPRPVGVSRGSCAACASRTAYPSCFAARAGASSKACGTFAHGMGRGCSRFASRDSSARRRSSFTSLPGRNHCAPRTATSCGEKTGSRPFFPASGGKPPAPPPAASARAGAAAPLYTTARLPSASRTASFAPSSSKVSSSPTPTRGRSRRYSFRRRGAAAFAAAASPSVRVPNMLPFRAPVK